MRKSSFWLRPAYFLGLTLLIFAGTWYAQLAETPPWKQFARTPRLEVPIHEPDRAAPTKHRSSRFRFVSYNLKNWLVSSQNPEKSPESKSAIIEILAASGADIIGLSEIGSEADVLEVRDQLKKAGRDLPYYHHTGGTDPIRHLAILSRFPITSTHGPDITIHQTEHAMQRGILDVTIEIDHLPVRFVGIHLKSKRIIPNFDQEKMRIAEAEHVRKHLDSILSAQAGMRLIAYGDFNDHIESLSTKIILGDYRSHLYLTPINVTDQRGEKWTYHYNSQDSYDRIDFITVSKALKTSIARDHSRIIDTPNWEQASDHRAVMVEFR